MNKAPNKGPKLDRRGRPIPDFKVSLRTLGRLMSLVMKHYKWRFILVMICILVTSFSTLQGTLFMQSLIDDHIKPMVETIRPNEKNMCSDYLEPLFNALKENETPTELQPVRQILGYLFIPGNEATTAAMTSDELTERVIRPISNVVATTEVFSPEGQAIVDDYITPMLLADQRTNNPDFAGLGRALIKLAIILAIGIICSYVHSRLMIDISQGTLCRLRCNLFATMEKLPIKYFDTHSHGDIMSIYTNDVDTLRQLIGNSIPSLVDSLITVVITFISMIVMSWQLTILSVLMILFTLFCSAKLGALAGKNFAAQQRQLGKVNGYIEEMVEGQKVVKVFCHEQETLDNFYAINDELRKSAEDANTYGNLMGPVNNNLGHLSYVLCAVAGAALAISVGATGTGEAAMAVAGVISLGQLVTFLQLNRNFSRPVSQVSQQMTSIVMAMAGAGRVFSLMDEQPEVDDGYVELVNAVEQPDGTLAETSERTHLWAWKHPHKNDNTVTYTKLEGGVTFGDVDFGYTDEKTVLHDITMYAMPGQKIAFVGGTGAGKTTITNLINRFYDIQDGKIRYDGININKIKKDSLRRSLGIVLQDTHLFTGTVMENIRYGRLDATDEECKAAARLANADGFIRRLPNGYDTLLTGDGANLSQGQRQLLAIARAAVADPPCLILDEATSSIDTRTETLVQRGMDALMNDRTTFVIAHRLSTVRNSDCIMVLEQGRIIERGTHDQLIEQRGKYYQLYTGNAITE